MSFANIFCWQDSYHSMVAQLHGWLLIRFTTDDNQTAYMQPVGSGDEIAALEALAADAKALGTPLRLFGLDEHWKGIVERYCGDKVAFHASPSHADYIYLSKDLATLPGRKYQPKRNFINRFTSRYSYDFKDITADNLEDCLYLNRIWCDQKGVKSTDPEQLALRRAFDNFLSLNLRGWILYADSTPAAFAMGSEINHDTFCIHIEKCDAIFEGASAMINNLVATELTEQYRYINREDDLGLEGLRRAKQSYYPTIMLTKYSALQLTAAEADMRQLWHDTFGDDIATIDHFFIRLYNSARCFTHSINNRTVAMLHIVPIVENGEQNGYIYAVATAPEFRGQGIASDLIRRAIDGVQKGGIYNQLLLIPANEQLVSFYKKFGFEPTGELFTQPQNITDYDLGSGNSAQDFVMRRKIL